MLLACLGLGAWQRYYWTPRVEVLPQAASQRFKLRGHFLRFQGPESVAYEFYVVKPGGAAPVVYKQGAGSTWRRGWWTYSIDQDLSLNAEPGAYEVWLKPQDFPEIRGTLEIR
jgi:hypothetical protein